MTVYGGVWRDRAEDDDRSWAARNRTKTGLRVSCLPHEKEQLRDKADIAVGQAISRSVSVSEGKKTSEAKYFRIRLHLHCLAICSSTVANTMISRGNCLELAGLTYDPCDWPPGAGPPGYGG